ncbi:putative quinol monooxygenase [Ensifer sp.]|jgi:quinol monooxygenase YgiN|uniref:putative quinol monooxygenase n=1 Tax=Ensifer sp. TaxID=1872086 RepID=UPI002E0DA42B|nr:putative quinol monooxygenase [Ensifer sp.]
MLKTMRLQASAVLLVGLFATPALSPSALAQEGPGQGYGKIASGAYSIVAEVRAKPGKEAELRAITLPLVDLVRGDPANLVYFLQENREKPGHFVFYEIFANEADFEAHNAMPYVQEWFAKLPDLADGGVTVTRMQVLAPAGN